MLKRHGGVRTALSVALALVISGGALALPAEPAAASLLKFVTPTSWAYTDSREASTPHYNTTGKAPVGSWRDDEGKHRKSRSYFTFDLSSYRGKLIKSAVLIGREVEVNDCEAARRIEIWQTGPVGSSTTWQQPPAELSKINEYGEGYYGCPSSYLGKNITDLITATVAAGQQTLTIELRVPGDLEGNVHLGRKFRRDLGISIDANTTPGLPSDLTVDGKSCLGQGQLLLRSRQPVLTARVTDDDVNETGGGDYLYPTFAVWPLADPSARTEWDGPGPVTNGYPVARSNVPAGVITDDAAYGFQVRSRDADSTSPWSAECHFTIDSVRPSAPPTVSSTDYPDDHAWTHGGPGIPGDFTFGPNGVTDIAGYYYGIWGARSFIAAGPDGSVTFPITPDSDGPQVLYVHSVDKAGNRSDTVYYYFTVRPTAPYVEDADPDAWAGDPHRLTFRPNMDDVVSYTYRLDEGDEQIVAAAVDGTAQVTVTPVASFSIVTVRSKTAAGLWSGEATRYLWVSSAPLITSTDFPTDGHPGLPAGETGSFTLRPHMHGVVEYVYQFNEEPAKTVAAGPDGSATITYAPSTLSNSLTVYSRTADGVESESGSVSFHPLSIAPTVESADYPEYAEGGGPGIAGAFTFRPTAENVVAYLYSFGDEPQQTVAAAADGTAGISWTPQRYDNDWGGWTQLLVQSRDANGRISDPVYYSFQVSPLAPTIVWPGEGTIGQPVQITLTSHLPGSTSFVYTLEGVTTEVPVGADGTHVITWTPQQWGSHDFTVVSKTAAGITSGSAWSYFYIYYTA